MKSEAEASLLKSLFRTVEPLTESWFRIVVRKKESQNFESLAAQPGIDIVQPNYPLAVPEEQLIQDPLRRAMILRFMAREKSVALVYLAEVGGTTADFVKALRHAMGEGARQFSDLWVKQESVENKALAELVASAKDQGASFGRIDGEAAAATATP